MSSPVVSNDRADPRPSPPESISETLQVDASSVETKQEADARIARGIEATTKGRDFWLSFAAMIVSIFLSALDLTSIGTALPTIADALNDTKGDFTWVGNAYAVSSTAIMPLSGSLSDAFGRKPIMLIGIGLFAFGSALAGAAQDMPMMIGARTVQGLGGGTIINLVEILISDLVPLSERGTYQGMIGLTWSFASAIAPIIAGALADQGKTAWRWLFYLNLPLTGMAFLLVFFFLNVRTPPGTVREKLRDIDWFGNAIVIVGTTLAVIGMTWGGIRYDWTDAHVLAPLLIGGALIVIFLWYEWNFPKVPTVPKDLLQSRTTLSAILMTAMHGITSISLLYYLPVFFQAAKGASPIRAAVEFLPSALIIAPFALSSGFIVAITGKYRPVNWFGWALTIVGFGVLSLIDEDTGTGLWVLYQIIVSAGSGLVFSAPIFPLLAPQPIERTAAALALFAFTRAFTQTWGIAIGSTIMQNELKKNLPQAFLSQFNEGAEIAFAAIPMIASLEEPLKHEVQKAFADSMQTIWQTMIGIAGIGFLSSFLMKEIAMVGVVDEKYALQSSVQDRVQPTTSDAEKGAVAGAST